MAGNDDRIFSGEDISKLACANFDSKIDFENPVLVDVDKNGDFDALKFKNGNVQYYKNTGSLQNPLFVLEDKHYDSYSVGFLLSQKYLTRFFCR